METGIIPLRTGIAQTLRTVVLSALVMAGGGASSFGQTVDPGSRALDLVPIQFTVRGLGSVELGCLVRDTTIYLPVADLFEYLRIRRTASPGGDSFTGFLVSPETTFSISIPSGSVRVGDRSHTLAPGDYVLRDGVLYFSPALLHRAFYLAVRYRPRTLSATLSTPLELPYVRDGRLARLEASARQRLEQTDDDLLLTGPFRWVDGFRFDWFVSQTLRATRVPGRVASAQLSSSVLGGEMFNRFNARLSPDAELVESRHLWRYVPARSRTFRELLVGDFFGTGLLSREMYGVRLSNAPPSGRLFFVQEPVAGSGVPGRRAYLFQGSVLTDAVPVDSVGRYSLEVPLRYGVNLLDVRSYDRWGVPEEDSYRINIPENLVPAGDIDYSVTMARRRERSYPWYGQIGSLWGVSRVLTLGAEAEYYDDSPTYTKVFPSLSGTLRLTSDLVADAIVSPAALFQGGLAATFPSLLSFSSQIRYYRSNRLFNPRNATYDIDLTGSQPFWLGTTRVGVSTFFRQSVLPASRDRFLRVGVAASMGFFYPQFSFLSGWTHLYARNVTTRTVQEADLALRWRARGAVFLGVGTSYDFLRQAVRSVRFNASITPLRDLSIEATYNRNLLIESSILRVDLRYIFPFARTAFTATSSRGSVSYTQRANGSIGFLSDLGEFFFEHRNRAQFGGFLIRPFLDANGNGLRDQNEEPVRSLRPLVSVEQGFIPGKLSRADGSLWGSLNAVPYREHLVSFPEPAFDDPGLLPSFPNFRVVPRPGKHTIYDIPVIQGGRITGTVYVPATAERAGRVAVEGITVRLRRLPRPGMSESVPVGIVKTAKTFSNGDFDFTGLLPGDYEVSIPGGQVQNLGYAAERYFKKVTLSAVAGEVPVQRVDFELSAAY